MTVKDYLFQKASIKKIPLSGTFELSPVCNFSCKMCYVRKTQESISSEGKRLHTAEEWITLAKECKEAGMLYLLLTGGEPFLYPDFRYLYETLHNMGIVISINTNGTMIDADTVSWLKDHAPARVNITLYGASARTYERICGNPAGYHRAVDAILALKKAGIPVVINASIIPENKEDMQDIIRFGKEHDIVVRVGTYMFPPVRRSPEDTDSRLSPEEAGRLNVMKQFYAMDEEQFIHNGEVALMSCRERQGTDSDDWGLNEGEQIRCRAGKSTFWIDWEGKMTACGIMDFPLAKFPFKDKFLDCWMDLTEQVRACTVLGNCQGCEKREVCYPCAAILYAETGDVNSKAPYLCGMADSTITHWKKMLIEKKGQDRSGNNEKRTKKKTK